VAPSMAEKPEWTGKDKTTDEQKAKKSEQIQKELDKGSEKGKESRETNNKKWWEFWANKVNCYLSR